MRFSLALFIISLICVAQGTAIENASRGKTLSVEENLIQLHSAFKSLKKGRYGSLLFDMISLQVQSKGPLDFLIDTIRALGKDQVEKYKNEEERFKSRSSLHEELTSEYDLALSKCNLEIKNTKKILENDLRPLLSSVSQSLKRLRAEIEDSDLNFKKAQQDREQQIKIFKVKSNDYIELLQMVGNAVEYMNELLQAEELNNAETVASLLQVNTKKARLEISKILNKFNDFHGLYAAFASALTEVIVSKNRGVFADKMMVAKVVELLTQLKVQFEENFNTLKESETRNESNFKELETQFNTEKQVFGQKLVDEEGALKELQGTFIIKRVIY